MRRRRFARYLPDLLSINPSDSRTPFIFRVPIPSISPGIFTALLLFLNEFPDTPADRAGGRRHLVILLGYKRAAVLYCAALTLAYCIIVAGVAARVFPRTLLLGLFTIPLAVKAAVTAVRHGSRFEKMAPALGANVGVVLGTDVLIAVAYMV